jgi:hypothetical protein
LWIEGKQFLDRSLKKFKVGDKYLSPEEAELNGKVPLRPYLGTLTVGDAQGSLAQNVVMFLMTCGN